MAGRVSRACHAFLAALTAAFLSPQAAAQGTPFELRYLADATFASELDRLIRAGDWAAALGHVEARPDIAARPDAIRLRAALLHRLGRLQDAVSLLERRLGREPDDAMARFQIGEIWFEERRDQAAAQAYRLALSGDLDQVRQSVAHARLQQIADRREWRFWLGGGVAPDSNINSATDARRIDLYGLPFELDDDARRRSGVSLSLFGGAERRFRWSPHGALRVALLGSANDGPGAAFDSASLSLRAGPEWRIGSGFLVSVQASAGERWFAGEELERRSGVFTSAEYASASTVWSGALQGERIDDVVNDSRDGYIYGLDVARTRYLSPSVFWRFSFSANTREAAAASEGYVQGRLAVGRPFSMPYSVLAYVEPYMQVRRYNAANFAFGEVREDIEGGIGVRLSKRDWVVADAYPFVAISLARSDSTIAIGDYTRERIELGISRTF